MGLFLVQCLFVAYQLSFVMDAGRPQSTARASRVPDGMALGHLFLTVLATGLWLGWRTYGERGWAWVGFAAALLAAALGAVIAQRSMAMPPEVSASSDRDPADLRTAESRIPEIAVVLIGVISVVLVVLTFLVALGVFN